MLINHVTAVISCCILWFQKSFWFGITWGFDKDLRTIPTQYRTPEWSSTQCSEESQMWMQTGKYCLMVLVLACSIGNLLWIFCYSFLHQCHGKKIKNKKVLKSSIKNLLVTKTEGLINNRAAHWYRAFWIAWVHFSRKQYAFEYSLGSVTYLEAKIKAAFTAQGLSGFGKRELWKGHQVPAHQQLNVSS